MPKPKGQTDRVRKTIVFVDNDRLFLEAVADFLHANGYDVQTAGDGLEALSLIRKVKPDYIILDIVLPKLDGGQVCAAIRQDAKLRHTPIIAFSALSPQDYRFFSSLSADVYVAKGPLTAALQNIQTALRDFEQRGQEEMDGQILGYGNFQPHQMVRELLLERRHTTALLEAILPGVLEVGREGRILMVNPRACALLQKKQGQLVGEAFASLCPPGDRGRVTALVAELLDSPETTSVRTTLRLAERVVPVRLTRVVDEDERSLLVVFESEQAAAEKARGVRASDGDRTTYMMPTAAQCPSSSWRDESAGGRRLGGPTQG